MLNAMIEKSSAIGSKADSIDLGIEDVVDSFGIPIRQEDVGTTGYTISIADRYFLAENITFDPASSGLAAITIDVDNVELAFLRRTISQTGMVNATDGIRISSSTRGVSITEATIRDFTGNGVGVESSAQDIFLRSFNIKNVSGNGIDFSTSGATIIIVDCMIGGCGSDGINMDTCNDVLIEDCMLTDNGLSTTNNGVTILDSDRVILQNNMASDNMGNGFEVLSTTTGVGIVLEKCKAFENGDHGIFMSHIDDSVIKNCVSNENGSDGIRVNDCVNLEIINSYCSNNTDDNIVLGTESTGSSDCHVF